MKSAPSAAELTLLPLVESFFGEPSSGTSPHLAELISRLSLLQIWRADRTVRRSLSRAAWSENHLPGWSGLTVQHVEANAARWGWEILALCTFHPSGWVRATALNALCEKFPRRSFPFVLVRTGDWVPEIQDLALQRALPLLDAGRELAWLRALPLIDVVQRTYRAKRLRLGERVQGYLQTSRGQAAAVEACRDEDASVRLRAYQFLRERFAPLSAELVRAAIFDASPQVARVGLEHLLVPSLDAALLPVLRDGLRSKNKRVRMYCLDAYARRTDVDSRAEVISALRDRSTGVREFARHYAEKNQLGIDLQEFYRGLLTSPSPVQAGIGIRSVAELGVKDVWSLLAPFLASPVPKLRRLTFQAATHLEVPGLRERLQSALRDPAEEEATRKLAARLLSRMDG